MSLEHINVNVEFRGGLELLFSNQRSHKISLPAYVRRNTSNGATGKQDVDESDNHPADVKCLLIWLKKNLLKEREELFLDGDTVSVFVGCMSPMLFCILNCLVLNRRPGILVLINDTDWELEGEGDYILKDGDEVVLISTLHGG